MATRRLTTLSILFAICTIINRTLSISVYQIGGETEHQGGKRLLVESSGRLTSIPPNLHGSANADDRQAGKKDLRGKEEQPLEKDDPENVAAATKNVLVVVKGSIEDQVIAEVCPEFLSITVSSHLTQHHWSTFNTSSPRLQAMSRALSPAILRMGGSSANFLTYEPGAHQRPSPHPLYPDNDFVASSRDDGMSNWDDSWGGLAMEERASWLDDSSASYPWGEEVSRSWTNFTLLEDDWARLNKFVKAVGWQLLFDLNQFYRDPEGIWDPSNALLLFKSAQDQGHVDILWQLGNEPGAYAHHFNFSITGSQMAEDVSRLRSELKDKFPEMYKNTLIVGPDTTRPKHLKSQDMGITIDDNASSHAMYSRKGEVQTSDNADSGFLRSDFENEDKHRIPGVFSFGSFDSARPQYNSKNVWDTLAKSQKVNRKVKKDRVHENSIYGSYVPAFLFRYNRKDKESVNGTENLHKTRGKSDGLGYNKEFSATNEPKADFSGQFQDIKRTQVDFSRETRKTSDAQVDFHGNSEGTNSERVHGSEDIGGNKSKQFDDSRDIRQTGNEREDNDAESEETNHGRGVFNNIKQEIGAEDSKTKASRKGTNIKSGNAREGELQKGETEDRTGERADEESETKAGESQDIWGEGEGETTLGTDSVEFLKEFLEHVGDNIDVVSWHQYYLNGRTARKEDFLSPEVLDLFPRQLKIVMDLRNSLAPEKPVWLTETGSAYGGGAPELSDRFVASFMYLDKLGVAAEGGVSVVARQTFYMGSYAMIGADLIPNPDFWVAALYKRLVGQRVLRFPQLDPDPNVRLYASCAANYTSYYRPGAVVAYGVNLGVTEVEVRLQGRSAASPVLQFLLQPTFGKLTDRDIMLNGRPVELVNDALPDLGALETPPGGFRIPPHSLGFWLLRDAQAISCY